MVVLGFSFCFSKFSSKIEMLTFDTTLVVVGSNMTAWLCHFDDFQNHSTQILLGISIQDNNGNGYLPIADFPLGLFLVKEDPEFCLSVRGKCYLEPYTLKIQQG